MENMLSYIARLCQSNLILGLVLIVGIFVVLICLAAVDRKIGYMRKGIDLLLQHEGLEIPQPEPKKSKKQAKAEETTEANDNK